MTTNDRDQQQAHERHQPEPNQHPANDTRSSTATCTPTRG